MGEYIAVSNTPTPPLPPSPDEEQTFLAAQSKLCGIFIFTCKQLDWSLQTRNHTGSILNLQRRRWSSEGKKILWFQSSPNNSDPLLNIHKRKSKILSLISFPIKIIFILILVPWGRFCCQTLGSCPPTGQTCKDLPPHVLSHQALMSEERIHKNTDHWINNNNLWSLASKNWRINSNS